MRKRETDETALNLAPIMNMVVILIPLLLLSIVFFSVGVINASAPSVAPGPSSGEPAADPRVTLAIAGSGFIVSSRDGELGRIEVEDEHEFRALMKDLENARDAGDRAAEERALDEMARRYDWGELYGTMIDARKRYPEAEALHLTADPDIPYAMVVKALDAVRFELAEERYASDSQFWAASFRASSAPHSKRLFADPVFNVAR